MQADALSQDAFLGGRLTLFQPRKGYRAGVDPVFLAAAVPARAGEQVLDLGCGVGAAALCLLARVPGLGATGLELQAPYAALARRNAAHNALNLQVIEGDVAAPPPALRALSFDHVIMNPPYFIEAAACAAPDPGRALAQREAGARLAEFLDQGLRRLRQGGSLTVIHRAERLADLLAGLSGRAGDIRVLPLQSRSGRAAGRVLVQARKGARAPLTLLAPFTLHEGARHVSDGADYTAKAEAILRGVAPLPLGDDPRQ
nr:methyltransferase [Oceanibium sediminis]